MVKMNKKGFIRTLEAVIAIVLLLTFIFWIMPSNIIDESDTPAIISAAEDLINHELMTDNELRNYILEADLDDINSVSYINAMAAITQVIEDRKPYGYEYQIAICADVNCYIDASSGSVYMNDILISSDMEGNQELRIVRMWFY